MTTVFHPSFGSVAVALKNRSGAHLFIGGTDDDLWSRNRTNAPFDPRWVLHLGEVDDEGGFMEVRSAHEELEDQIVAAELPVLLEAWMESVLPARIGAAIGGFWLYLLPRLWSGETPRLDVSADTAFGGVRRLSAGAADGIAAELRRIADFADSIPGRPHEETGKVGLRPVWTMEMRVSESGSERTVDLASAHADLSDARRSLAAKASIVGLIYDGFDVEPKVRIEPPVLARQGLRDDVADLMRGIVPASLR